MVHLRGILHLISLALIVALDGILMLKKKRYLEGFSFACSVLEKIQIQKSLN